MRFFKETTKWDRNTKNHTYAFENGACVGYIKAGTTELLMFSRPSRLFSKSRRTFVEVK